jgi:ubiquinone/menaquinone biosynthesis C-methylase UbiE
MNPGEEVRTVRWERWKEVLKGYLGRGVHPHELSFSLTLPLRRLILSPETLAERLHLDASFRVLELGPGPGYFSAEVARRLPHGRLELFDLQRGMLETARRRLEAVEMHNADFIQGDARRLPFGAEAFDVVFLVAVLGEVPDPAACLRSVYRALRPGGLFSNTEQPGDPDFLPLERVRALAEAQGFVFIESFGRGKNYTVNLWKHVGQL